MESKKQCPNCGKYVPFDRTYCMNCGTTIGVRCPNCKKVHPLGTKECTVCGHSFVRKSKRQMPAFFKRLNKQAKPVLGGLMTLFALAALILAATPSLLLIFNDEPIGKAAGYTLIGYFLGAHPAAITELLSFLADDSIATALRFALYGEGLGWLISLIGWLLGVVLVLPNLRRMTRVTSRRLLLPMSMALGGSMLTFGMDLIVRHQLNRMLAPFREVYEINGMQDPCTVGAAAPILLLIFTLVAVVGALYLHMAVFRKLVPAEGEAEAERKLSYLLSEPLIRLSRLAARLWAHIRRGKGRRRKKNRDERTVVCTSRFSTYLILLAVAVVFTQALLSKVSNIFFWFVLILPGILLLYVLVAKVSLSVTMLSDSATTEKNSPYTYELLIHNRAPLAFPFIEAQMSIPQSNSVRTSERTVRLAMPPLSDYRMKNTVRFRFRGTYDIGVRCFYVYDFFRIFRVQVPVENMTTVYVLPRRLTVEETMAQSVSDSTARTVRSPLVVDKLEVSDIRDYRAGDSLKSIHWKLSSKSEEFIVKDYNTGTSNQTVVFCDLAAHFPDEPPKRGADADVKEIEAKPEKLSRGERRAQKKAVQDQQWLAARRRRRSETPETHEISDEALEARLNQRATAAGMLSRTGKNSPATAGVPEATAEIHDVHELAAPILYEDMNEYLADGVVELTIANVLAELHQGHEVLLIWFDRRSDAGIYVYQLRGVDAFERIYNLFGTAPLCTPDKSVALLTTMTGDTESAKQLFVVSTMDKDMMTVLSDLPGVSDAANFGSAEVLLYNPEDRFRFPVDRAQYLEGCRQQLAASGVSLRICGDQSDQPHPNTDETRTTDTFSGKGGIAHG